MNMKKALLCAALIATVQACGTQQVYDGLQASKRHQCQRYPEPDRTKCLATTDKDYETFRRERDEMLLK
jgi:hypothetical protein